MARKTVSVALLLFKTNFRNMVSTVPREVRQAWNTEMEDILHDTGNYKGYSYLDHNQVPPGEKPGIRTDREGFPDFSDTDPTRVCFGVSDTLRAEYAELRDRQAEHTERCLALNDPEGTKYLSPSL